MPYEIVTTTSEALYWRPSKGKGGRTVNHLIQEIGYLIHFVRNQGLQGFKNQNGKPHGLSKIPFLVERGLMKPMIVPIGEEDDYYDPWEVTDLPGVEAALAELIAVRDGNPPRKSKSARPL